MFKTIVKTIDKMLWPQRVAKGQICNAGVWPWLAAIAKAIAGGVGGAIGAVGKAAGAIGQGVGGAIGLGGSKAATAAGSKALAGLGGTLTEGVLSAAPTKVAGGALGAMFPNLGVTASTINASPAIAAAATKPGLLESLAQEGLKTLKKEGGAAIMSGAMNKAAPPADVPLPPGGSMDYGTGSSGAPPYQTPANAPVTGGIEASSRVTPEMLLEMLKVKQKFQGQV
jgi:hypothetical protein